AAALAVCAIVLMARMPQFFRPRGDQHSSNKISELSSPTPEARKQFSPRPEDELLSKRTVHLRQKVSMNVPPNVETPEVLVPPQEGAALAQYVALLRKRAIKVQTLPTDEAITVKPLEIAEIDLGQLSIPFVQSEETGSPN